VQLTLTCIIKIMKKRTLLAILLTVLCLIATNKFWLIYKPTIAEFKIRGEGKYNIELQLNQKNNAKFKKNRFYKKEINLSDKSVFKTEINPKKAKRFRFIVSSLNASATRERVEIQTPIRLGKVTIDNFNDFEIQNATSTIQNKSLILSSQNEKIILTYKKPIKIRASKRFLFETFTIILILSFLLFYKLFDYIADFKTIKHKSRIEIIFLVAFFVILFIPLSNISQEKTSKSENRTLAIYKPFINKKGEINYNFGKNYDKYFNDRFNGRNTLIKINDKIQKTANDNFYIKNNYILNKKNGWMGDTNYLKENSNTLFEEKDLNKALKNIERIKKFCNQNNIKLYILIAPIKEEIYSKEILDGIYDFNMYKKSMQMKKFIKEKTGIDILYTYDIMKNLSKEELAYFKTDHHWTDEGAYRSYVYLMNKIKKDFPKVYIHDRNNFEYFNNKKIRVIPGRFWKGYTYNILIEDEEYLTTSYKYFKHKDINKISYKETDCKNGCWARDYKYNKDYPNLYFYGDSFTLNMLQFIPYSFNKTKNLFIPAHRKNSNIAIYEKDIIKNKPDILVLCFSGMNRLTMIYKDTK